MLAIVLALLEWAYSWCFQCKGIESCLERIGEDLGGLVGILVLQSMICIPQPEVYPLYHSRLSLPLQQLSSPSKLQLPSPPQLLCPSAATLGRWSFPG